MWKLCALGTIADLVPLRGENRILVKEGLKRMKKGLNTGVQALLTSSGLTPDTITAGRIAFTAAPRLNAAGRISHATRGVEVLLESDAGKATSLADELSELNKERQDIEHTIAEQAVNQIEEKGQSQDGVLVAYGNDWHSGVIGIAASRLVEKFYRPLWSSVFTMALAKDHAAAFLASTCMKPCSQPMIC
jgi:single-stranded-DNA-specific exonuclease